MGGRGILCLLVLGSLSLAGRAAPSPDREARVIIEKAIKALGGEQNIKKLQAMKLKATCTTTPATSQTPTHTVEHTFRFPDKIHDKYNVGAQTLVYIINGDKGWVSLFQGQNSELKDPMLSYVKTGWRHLHVEAFYSDLLKDRAYSLSLLKPIRVSDQAAVGVKIKHKGDKDTSLYFDRDSGLLLKAAYQNWMPQTGQDVLWGTHIATSRKSLESNGQPRLSST